MFHMIPLHTTRILKTTKTEKYMYIFIENKKERNCITKGK